MRKHIVAGNWKMYGSRKSVVQLLSDLIIGVKHIHHEVEIVVFPSCVFLDETNQLLSGTKIRHGAQNVYPAAEGAYTGEISPLMLREFGCEYVLVGHSERRHILGETNDEVAAKFVSSQTYGLKPILCVGETRQEREAGKTYEVISAQLFPILNHEPSIKFLESSVIAYEPVWAIGTGLTATPEEAQDIHQFIRKELAKYNKLLAEKVCILYGGSVKKNNAAALFAMPDIDGGLIGGASLNATEFLEIAKLCN